MSDKSILFELKEKAKWSHNPEEKKAAIKELSTKGPNAIPQLEEIFNISAYEDIRAACAEAIREIRVAGKEGDGMNADSDISPATNAVVPNKSQKKEEREGENAAEGEIRLADLPP